MRKDHHLKMVIRLKTVIMRQNLAGVCQVARFAEQEDLEVFYQPIEQNYNTAEDALWFTDSDTWPQDTKSVIAVVEELTELKRRGLPIVNSPAQLAAMIPYFTDPAESRIAVQSHSAHEPRQFCSALTMLQFQANGDVVVCNRRPAIGNIKTTAIREIWENRSRWWEGDCCLDSFAGFAPLRETSSKVAP
jgi:hypothetical protein